MTDIEVINGITYWISPETGEYIAYTPEELERKAQYDRITNIVAKDMATRYGYKIKRF